MALAIDKTIEAKLEKIIQKSRRKRIKATPVQIIGVVFLSLVALIYIYPILWMLDSSFRPAIEIFNLPPKFLNFSQGWPFFSSYSLNNYIAAFHRGVGLSFLMSVTVTTFGVLLTLLLSSLCAYAFAFLRFPFKNILFFFILFSFMLPTITQIPPYYKLLSSLDAFPFFAIPLGIFLIYRIILLINRFNAKNLIYVIAILIGGPLTLYLLNITFGLGRFTNNLLGLIIPSSVTAIGVFLLRQFYIKLPYSLIESAFLDGASHFKIWWNIIIPLSMPALAALSIFQFRGLWNDFLFPMILLRDQNLFTIPVEIKLMDSINFNKPYDAIMATGFLFSLIPIIIFLIFQRYFVEGLSGGAKK